MALAILGIPIKIETLSAGVRSMYIHMSRWHTFYFGTWTSLTVTRWCRWYSGQMWRRFWWKYTCALAPPASLWILCCTILARKAAVRLIFMNHCRVSSYPSLHIFVPRKYLPHFISSQTSPRGFVISCCVASIVECKNPPLAILAIFKARCMSDCSSCTRPPCLTTVADMLKTYIKSVRTSKVRSDYYLNHIWLHSLL